MAPVNRIDTSFEIIEEGIKSCTQCPLYRTRTHAVPGEGPERPALMLIGEAPGKNEDLEGRPFCGAAGKKLDAMLEVAGLHRKDIFITSILKCRPPENRVPTKEEGEMCTHTWLWPQIQLLKPKLIGLMGNTAIKWVLGEKFECNLSKDHGKIITHQGHDYVLLYHPAAMIYNQSLKETMEKDFGKVAQRLSKS
jgi:DNA polymerase